jgi:hypothetical protein
MYAPRVNRFFVHQGRTHAPKSRNIPKKKHIPAFEHL